VLAAQKEGFSPREAIDLCCDLLTGSSKNIANAYTLLPDESNFNQVIDLIDTMTNNVCSKGGTTIEGVTYLDANHFSDHVANAALKAVARAKELSKPK